MTVPSHLSAVMIVVAQIGVGLAAMAMLAFAPPANGAMLLLPLVPNAATARLALEGDALVLAAAPAGGLVVRGDRDALFWPLLRAGVLAIAAPAFLCGKAA